MSSVFPPSSSRFAGCRSSRASASSDDHGRMELTRQSQDQCHGVLGIALAFAPLALASRTLFPGNAQIVMIRSCAD